MKQTELETLFYKNVELAYFVMWNHYRTFAKNEDLKQEALLGLWQACLTYNKSKAQFSTYASSCILNRLRIWFRERNKHPETVSLSTSIGGYEEEGLTLEDTIEDPVPSIDEGLIDLKNFLGSLRDRVKHSMEAKK